MARARRRLLIPFVRHTVQEAGRASGATNAIRELGGVMGVAVLASAFSTGASYASPQAFTDARRGAADLGAAMLALGAVAALFVPATGGRRRPSSCRPRRS